MESFGEYWRVLESSGEFWRVGWGGAIVDRGHFGHGGAKMYKPKFQFYL